MIKARSVANKPLAISLERKAKALAEAAGETTALEHRQSALRWRRADLVWPLFTRGG